MGSLHLHEAFASSYLSTRRNLVVYVPDGYEENTGVRYPVFYLQDGQNLFDPATAFGGNTWRAGETADELIRSRKIPPLLLVGIWNTGVRRMSEYTPTRCAVRRKGGKAGRYAQMLAREIKPFVDKRYRTLKPAKHTAVGGSSLGALAALTTVLQYPRVFGNAAVISPSVWWDECSILSEVEDYRSRVKPRIWLDMGTAEGDKPELALEQARLLRDSLLAKGWSGELDYREFDGSDHSEAAWAARFDAVLIWLSGK